LLTHFEPYYHFPFYCVLNKYQPYKRTFPFAVLTEDTFPHYPKPRPTCGARIIFSPNTCGSPPFLSTALFQPTNEQRAAWAPFTAPYTCRQLFLNKNTGGRQRFLALQGGKDPVRHRALGGGRPEASGLREAPPGRERPRERARGAEGEWGAQAGPRSAGSAHRRQLAARRGSAERRAMEPSPKDGESAAAAEPSRGAGSSSGVVVQVREKKGPLRAAIPYMPFPVAVICLFLNTFVPGLGTLVSAFTVLCGARTDLPDRHMCCVFWLNIAAALIQILTAIVMVGWIMSIFWGMDMVILARSSRSHLC
uniref:Stum, mechanosensory transduction mediator homolog n=2 Tax=Anatinae TaxID=2068716 RepID=A0A8B9ZXH1_9AVES